MPAITKDPPRFSAILPRNGAAWMFLLKFGLGLFLAYSIPLLGLLDSFDALPIADAIAIAAWAFCALVHVVWLGIAIHGYGK
ncbi:MAG: hypothetical protein R3B98_09865 [Hyphomonas sp.]